MKSFHAGSESVKLRPVAVGIVAAEANAQRQTSSAVKKAIRVRITSWSSLLAPASLSRKCGCNQRIQLPLDIGSAGEALLNKCDDPLIDRRQRELPDVLRHEPPPPGVKLVVEER